MTKKKEDRRFFIIAVVIVAIVIVYWLYRTSTVHNLISPKFSSEQMTLVSAKYMNENWCGTEGYDYQWLDVSLQTTNIYMTAPNEACSLTCEYYVNGVNREPVYSQSIRYEDKVAIFSLGGLSMRQNNQITLCCKVTDWCAASDESCKRFTVNKVC